MPPPLPFPVLPSPSSFSIHFLPCLALVSSCLVAILSSPPSPPPPPPPPPPFSSPFPSPSLSPPPFPLPLLFTQILAVYNTIGTVIRGHPTKLTDVIDYVVFERPLTKSDSRWRIAAKLPPQLPLKTSRSEKKGLKALSA